jgi:3-deoxy-D-manno-octulosonic-acid transferase
MSGAGEWRLGRALPGSDGDWPERPPGQLVWVHAARAERVPAILQLAARLIAQREVHVLVTAPQGLGGPRRLKPGTLWCTAPADDPEVCARFLAHVRPDVCVWTSGDLRPRLVEQAVARELLMVMVDATEDGFGAPGLRDRFSPLRRLLRAFSTILASDANAAERLRRLGLGSEDVAITGPLQEGSAALPSNETDLADLNAAIGTRPVWLAAMVQPEETTTVLRAHRAAARYAQRLLLILVPDRPDIGEDMRQRIAQEELPFVCWSESAFPDDDTEVVLADTYGEMGLWYRLASVSFMASSLIAHKGGSDPFEPAALGSAILYGPNCGRHLHAYSRLAEVGAARMVRDTDSLAGALKTLVAPDRAAAMSLAAWGVVSEGAEVSDRVTDLVHDFLDVAEAL